MSFLDFFRQTRQLTQPAAAARSYRPSVETLEVRECPAVTAPVGLQLTALSPTQVKITWNDVAGETGYKIYQWSGTQAIQIANVSANVTTFTVNQLAANHKYYFTVSAFDSGTSAQAAWGTVTTPLDTITAPTNLRTLAATTTQVTLGWNDSTGETGYRIFGWDGSKSVLLGTTGANVTSFAVNNLAPGQTYYFYVQAFNANNTASSAWLTASTSSVSITAPGNLQAQVIANDKIQLNWTDSVGETGYRVYRWDGTSSAAVLVATLAANTTSYQAVGLQFGTTYWFYVQAFNATNVANTAWVSKTTPVGAQLQPPTDFQVTAAGSTSALLSWDDAAGAVGYRVYYWTGFQWTWMTTVQQGQQQVQINGLQNNRTHWFLIQAYTANNLQVANTNAMFVVL